MILQVTMNEKTSSGGVENNTTTGLVNGTTNSVAIDNKIEQAMDLVKTHLLYAVREEVEVLKERIVELEGKIVRLETENKQLRKHAPTEVVQFIQQQHQLLQDQEQQQQQKSILPAPAASSSATIHAGDHPGPPPPSAPPLSGKVAPQQQQVFTFLAKQQSSAGKMG